jgi:hypothetical protein
LAFEKVKKLTETGGQRPVKPKRRSFHVNQPLIPVLDQLEQVLSRKSQSFQGTERVVLDKNVGFHDQIEKFLLLLGVFDVEVKCGFVGVHRCNQTRM